MDPATTSGRDGDGGWTAVHGGWDEQYARLTEADPRSPLGPDELERLGLAAYLTGHDQESTDALSRAYGAHLDANEPEDAVRCAFWVGFGLFQRGDAAQAGGWMAQGSRLVEERGLDCVECGYLLIPAGLMSLSSGALDEARSCFQAAEEVARRFADPDLRALSGLGQGQALLGGGRTHEGTHRFDEVMVSVTAGEVSPVVAGIVYCAVIDECQEAFDVRRAQGWTAALSRWCEAQPDLVPYRGQCLVHRSQVLHLHGAWPAAMEEARRAHRRLTEPPHPALGMAHYQLGELHRLQGDLGEAEAAYLDAHEHGRSPHPGLALVRQAQGRVKEALAAVDAAVAEAGTVVDRARLLPAFIQITLAADQRDRARDASSDLDDLAAAGDSPYLDAVAAAARGGVLLADGDPRGALAALRSAWRGWRELEVPYEEAQTRVLIALACRELGDHECARLESDAARRILAQLGASPALDRVHRLFHSSTPSGADAQVSPREVQVLRRVAEGMTNRAIADDLFISIKTVERHLSNTYIKLGAANRAAATAIANQQGML